MKKILIGSIVSVTILILVSFTSVIGYRSVESDVKVSPLFNIRSSKAIGKESKDISTDYLGHGEDINIPLLSRIKRAEQIQKATDIISKMNDKAFSNLVARIMLNLKYQEQKDTSDALQVLHNIRENPDDVKYYDTKGSPEVTLEYITCLGSPCLIQFIVLIFAIIFISILAKTFYMGCTQYPQCYLMLVN